MKRFITLVVLLCLSIPIFSQSKWERLIQIRGYEPLSVSMTNGVRFSESIMVGIGVGIGVFMKDEDGTAVGIPNGDMISTNQPFFPLFLSVKWDFLRNTKCSPYLKVDGGYAFGVEKSKCEYKLSTKEEIGGGYNTEFFNLSLGVDIDIPSKINQVFFEVGCDLSGFSWEHYIASREQAVFQFGVGFRF